MAKIYLQVCINSKVALFQPTVDTESGPVPAQKKTSGPCEKRQFFKKQTAESSASDREAGTITAA